MPRYLVLKKCYILDRIWNPGEIITFAGPGDPETMEPIDGAPMAPRKFDIPGGSGIPLEKRAELDASRDPDRHRN